jgi:DNA-binding response OmpR family regulator
MKPRHRILVVARDTSLASVLLTWLGGAHHELALVTTFAAAKLQLATVPDLLITEVKLGAYNGLHLALRAREAGIPALVLGEPDPVFERQAEQLGAEYLAVTDLEVQELRGHIDTLLEGDHRIAGHDLPLANAARLQR